jgi:hypothetical protein
MVCWSTVAQFSTRANSFALVQKKQQVYTAQVTFDYASSGSSSSSCLGGQGAGAAAAGTSTAHGGSPLLILQFI